MKKTSYENMSKEELLDMISELVYEGLKNQSGENTPKLTQSQLETISFENSIYEHRIIFSQEGKDVEVTLKATEVRY